MPGKNDFLTKENLLWIATFALSPCGFFYFVCKIPIFDDVFAKSTHGYPQNHEFEIWLKMLSLVSLNGYFFFKKDIF